jgi:beta-lactamase class D
MRKLLLTALLLCFTGLLGAQEADTSRIGIYRLLALQPGDSLMDYHSFGVGFSNSDSSLFFFFVRTAPDANRNQITLIYPAVSAYDGYKAVLHPDTLHISSSCFAPAQIDTVWLENADEDREDELCVLFSVYPYCDLYRPKQHLVVYDNCYTANNQYTVIHNGFIKRGALNELKHLNTTFPGMNMHKSPNTQFNNILSRHFAKPHAALPPLMRNDLNYLYDSIGVQGCFVLYDPQLQQYTYVNKSMATWQLTPASTFKICNTLIGLETGELKDEQQVFEWNGKKHQNPNWNKTQNLQEAYKNSTVWYYQELARRVGAKRMKMWLDSCGYGNADTTGGLTQFWLTGKLRISAEQQIEFLKLLHDNKLPFSDNVMGLTKEIMINEINSDFTLYGKTGWGYTDSLLMTGWYVGYVEVGNKIYYFANLLTTSTDYNNPHFKTARKALAYRMLREMQVIPSSTN